MPGEQAVPAASAVADGAEGASTPVGIDDTFCLNTINRSIRRAGGPQNEPDGCMD